MTLTKGFWMMRTEMTQELLRDAWVEERLKVQGAEAPGRYRELCRGRRLRSSPDAQARRGRGRCPRAGRSACRRRRSGSTRRGRGPRRRRRSATACPAPRPISTATLLTAARRRGRTSKILARSAATSRTPGGLVDTIGNVLEWTLDAVQHELPGGTDPFVVGDGASDRVARGGYWGRGGLYCRSARRSFVTSTDRHLILGFRLAAVSEGARRVRPRPRPSRSPRRLPRRSRPLGRVRPRRSGSGKLMSYSAGARPADSRWGRPRPSPIGLRTVRPRST